MTKTFRIVKNDLSEEALNAFHPLRYRIEQRNTILLFIHWWSTPTFAPPHNFETIKEASDYIREYYPNAIIYIRL